MCTICFSMRPYSEDCAYASLREVGDAAGSVITRYNVAAGDSFAGELSSAVDRDWVRVELAEGVRYTTELGGSSSGQGSLRDPLVTLRDGSGALLLTDDDSGVGLDSLLSFTVASSGTYYIDVSGYSGSTGTYLLTLAAFEAASMNDLAIQLTDGYWTSSGLSRRSFDVETGGTISVNLTRLDSDGQRLARWALEAWENVTGITFVETTNSGQITFDDSEEGAFAQSSVSGSTITSSFVNVDADWLSLLGTTIDSYAFQTYIHEIGHALGLGHAGNYNGSASYPSDANFTNDSWQASVMSYFTQSNNTSIVADFAWVISAMTADIIAIQNLYGVPTNVGSTAGSTSWGMNSNLNGYLGLICDAFFDGTSNSSIYAGNPICLTVWDSGGRDTLNLSNTSRDQRIDLRSEAISDVYGLIGNLIIGRGTIIENAIGGSGNDTLIGNSAANTLNGGAGADALIGGLGSDIYITDGRDTITEAQNAGIDRVQSSATHTLGAHLENLTLTGSGAINGTGNTLNNVITGNGGNNILNGGAGADTLIGGLGNDRLLGGSAADSFIFRSVSESSTGATSADVITDFVRGTDKINLSAIDAFASTSANDTFIWKGTAGFNSTTQGEVRYQKFNKAGIANDYTMVWIDNGADTVVEMAIRLTGLYDLAASDFIL